MRLAVPQSSGNGVVICAIASVFAYATSQGPVRPHALTLPGTHIALEKGWRMVWTADQRCAYTVPSTWAQAPDHAWAVQPDGRMSVTVVTTVATMWASEKVRLKDAWRPTAVLDDSDRRLWIERADPKRILHHVSISDGRAECSADLEIQRSADATSDLVQKIIAGVRVAYAADLEWMKR